MLTNSKSNGLKWRLVSLILGVFMASSFTMNAQTGKALHFDGNADVVYTGSTTPSLPSGNSPWTAEVWVKTGQTSIGNIISWGTRSNNQRVGIAVRNGGAAFIGQYNDLTPGALAKINDNKWYHVAVVCKGTISNNILIYVNGSLKMTGSGALNIVGQNLRLGNISSPSNGEYYNGTMDEVRIWNYARKIAQINADKANELTGSETGLIVYYNFNQGVAGGNNATESTLNDGAGGDHGTLSGFALSGTSSNWVGDSPSLIPPPNPLACEVVNPKVSCFGEDNGVATVNITSGQNGTAFTYSWSSGSNTTSSTAQEITGLAPGTQTVTVTVCAASATCAVTITETSEKMKVGYDPSAYGAVLNISTNGGNNGIIRTVVKGGKAPYTYSWTGPGNPPSNAHIYGLKAGKYRLEVTDANGCKAYGGPYNMVEP